MQSLAGGIFENDSLNVTIHCRPGSMVHCTSQASTIVHSMSVGRASYRVDIDIENDAFAEFMPDPVILFPGAHFSSSIALRTWPSGELILCDSILAHDPFDSNGSFSQYKSELIVTDESSVLLACDRFTVSGSSFLSKSPGLSGSYSVLGSMYFISRRRDPVIMIRAVRAVLEPMFGIYGGVSEMPNKCGIFIRLLAPNAHARRTNRALHAQWQSKFSCAP
jgi:urease accessory protein